MTRINVLDIGDYQRLAGELNGESSYRHVKLVPGSPSCSLFFYDPSKPLVFSISGLDIETAALVAKAGKRNPRINGELEQAVELIHAGKQSSVQTSESLTKATLEQFLKGNRYVHNDVFDAPEYEGQLLQQQVPIYPTEDMPVEKRKKMERESFLAYNGAKHLLAGYLRRFDELNPEDVNTVQKLINIAQVVKSRIMEANVPLLMTDVAIYLSRNGFEDESELISEGYFSLDYCLEFYDVEHDNLFATYAGRSLQRAFKRLTMERIRRTAKIKTNNDTLEEPIDPRSDERHNMLLSDVSDAVDSGILDEKEMTVTRYRNGYDKLPGKKGNKGSSCRHKDVAAVLGVTTERVRQIERSANLKLREALEECMN